MKVLRKCINLFIALLIAVIISVSCTKYGDGFLSPTMMYSTKLMIVPKGQVAESNSLVSDGSSIPLTVKLLHIYNADGDNVDELFAKKYPVEIWKSGFDPNSDTSFAEVIAKRETVQLTPIVVNPTSGVIETNSATINIPTGLYSIDLQVTNSAGQEVLKNAISLDFQDVAPLEVDDSKVGYFASGRALAGTAPVTYFFNGDNNPFVEFSAVRVADAPNQVIMKITDRNEVPFNPKSGEIFKRPATGINPNPPFLQNLEDYAPDTYKALDTAMFLKYPVTPFPIVSLGNSFLMYYNIKANSVSIDSTSKWSDNVEDLKYKGTADSHFLGYYEDNRYDYSIRIPMRVQIPGSYVLTVKILNATHK